MFEDLLLPNYGEGDDTPDPENINQFILYYGNEDFAEVKRLCKEAMRHEFPDDFHNRNASDIILHVMKKYLPYATSTNPNTKTQIN